MYDIVADTNLYSLFVPYCTESRIVAKDPITGRSNRVLLKVGFGTFNESFESEVTYTNTAIIVGRLSAIDFAKVWIYTLISL